MENGTETGMDSLDQDVTSRRVYRQLRTSGDTPRPRPSFPSNGAAKYTHTAVQTSGKDRGSYRSCGVDAESGYGRKKEDVERNEQANEVARIRRKTGTVRRPRGRLPSEVQP